MSGAAGSADLLRAELARVASALGAPAETSVVLERPRDPSFGDWTTNLAMTLARPLGRKPREIAESIVAALDVARGGITAAEIAGPGFINFRLDPGLQASALAGVIAADRAWGRSERGNGAVVNVEFVSANPTGPLHVGHGRQAALGDAISTLLQWTGWNVSREFYYNDGGVQIENLAKSTWVRVAQARGLEVEIPEGGYHGEYIREIAASFVEANPALDEAVLREGVEAIVEGRRPAASALFDAMRVHAVAVLRGEQDLDLQAFGVRFDTYFLESSLYADGKVEETVRDLVAAGKTFEEGDALWLRTTEYGDDKDRVMRKRDGTFTYFVPDVAYHVTKWRRGFGRAINVQGADHHSTVTRVRAGLQALGIGIPQGYPEYVLHQMVTVMRGGEEVKISKRAGSYVTVRDLIEWVGRDAVRYFYLMRKGDSQLVFDVDLARSQSDENPIYRIQMAHARMCGIFRVGEIDRDGVRGEGIDLSPLAAPLEQELVKALVDFPQVVSGAAQALEPHRLATYLLETANLAHRWYHEHHVLGEPEPVKQARLVLARATQVVLRNGLAILGLTAPERM